MASKAVAIDAMSGDFGPCVIVPSTMDYLRDHADQSVILVGDSSRIDPLVTRRYAGRVSVVHTTDVVGMDEKPAVALRSRKPSSMRLAIDLVKSGEAGACVSAGNTGALTAIARHLLKTIHGVDRPAICGAVPSLESHSYLLDMGANVDCDAEQLLQFARMATVLVRAIDGKASPTVALLNNGEESIKGNRQVREAAELLGKQQGIHYIGYLEGHKIYEAAADIIVCDGFVGNVALKASEGVAKYVVDKIKQQISADPISRFLAIFAMLELRRIKEKVDPRRFNGASLLGLRGVVVKSHGHADREAFYYAIHHAAQMMSADIVQRLDAEFGS
jgi:glycerol-3-phosphate acyltransferase PlsX